jgi:trimethylamine--corrinoid protein Co-methyltransferase
MPLAGATAPVTLTGALVQHAAETLSGVVISQLAKEGAAVVWGGSPAALDMRTGNTPMGAVDTWMIDIGYVEIGKTLNLPTNAYLGLSDAKIVDAQCGLEASGGIFLASLAGVNMVSSPGMMDFESSQSFEKLVIDSEIIAMAKRLMNGVVARDKPIATEIMAEMGHRADYLTLPHTHKWFKDELHIPSKLIDRSSVEEWEREGGKSIFERARDRVGDLVKTYEPSPMSSDVRDELRKITLKAAQKFGMEKLPPLSLE